MPAAGRRTMPRPAVGVRPSASCYAPAVPRGLRLCREIFGGFAFYIRDVRRRVGRSDFRAPAVPRSLRPCRAVCGGHAFSVHDVRRRVGRSGFRAPAVPCGLRLCRGGAEGSPLLFPMCAAGALVFHSLRQIFSRCPH